MSRVIVTDVSVVIPNWNGDRVLLRCIDSVISDLRTSGLRHEIIVVDDKSQDDSVRILRERFPEIQIVLNQKNSGFAFSCNQGMQRAQGEFILLLNNDIIVRPGSIRRVWEFMAWHRDVGGAGCRILNESGEVQKTCHDFPSLPKLFKNRIFRMLAASCPKAATGLSLDCWPHDSLRAVDWISMMFFMVSRRVFEIIGGLDERFFMYGEDADYGWRLNQAGFKVVFVPDSSVVHLGSYSGNKRWGPMAMVRRQLALHELLRKWYSPYHVWGYRLGMTSVLVGRIFSAVIKKVLRRSMKEESDLALTLLLLRCNLGLLRNRNEKI